MNVANKTSNQSASPFTVSDFSNLVASHPKSRIVVSTTGGVSTLEAKPNVSFFGRMLRWLTGTESAKNRTSFEFLKQAVNATKWEGGPSELANWQRRLSQAEQHIITNGLNKYHIEFLLKTPIAATSKTPPIQKQGSSFIVTNRDEKKNEVEATPLTKEEKSAQHILKKYPRGYSLFASKEDNIERLLAFFTKSRNYKEGSKDPSEGLLVTKAYPEAEEAVPILSPEELENVISLDPDHHPAPSTDEKFTDYHAVTPSTNPSSIDKKSTDYHTVTEH